MQENKDILYAYLVGGRYKHYFVFFEGNEDLKEFNKTFTNKKELFEFVFNFSNIYSIPVQFYY